ncbi:unnamed protein product [Cylindrotheca closterium]|uniref:Uncharacterized protein n=1 Tax=Cylindrotheca closterium TaxID=2856 RepID=A0AAD2JLW7_9STRA|nr:unnamed protein product [Cylindrotheca closterium]
MGPTKLPHRRDKTICDTFQSLSFGAKAVLIGILITFFIGIILMTTVLILDHRLETWVDEHPRPANSVCDQAEPITIPSVVIDEKEEFASSTARCYPTHVGRSIYIWHTLLGTGGDIRVSYEISETFTSDYPAALGGSKKTATPKRIWVYSGECDEDGSGLTALDNRENNVTFSSTKNEKYYLFILGYGDEDTYSTHEFCINLEYLH